ncbi:MAG: SDR family oxidoreductase [Chitinophagaceae bacterium]|nr:MAG: SDR family oxidoreductase [Chitinophagaceae bacterium]
MQNTVFITGASSGLGKATAKFFQLKGWTVIATMRNPEREKELRELDNVVLLPLDVTNPEQVEQTISKVLREHRVDVVVNNAGYGLVGPLEALTDGQVSRQVETNLLGLIRVTKAFVPSFRERRSGTFINITSTFGLLSYPTCSVYSATKFGVDGFSEGLAYELASFNVAVKVVAPGGMQTDFVNRSMDGGQHEAYQQLVAKVGEGYSEEQVANYTRPEVVAQIIYDAATDGQNQLRYVAGSDADALYKERLQLGPEGQFARIRQQFLS